jgi:putative tricarboxylic transport membrane protein
MNKILIVALVILTLASCSNEIQDESQYLIKEIEIIAPASPGGGWDQTARLIQGVLLSQGLVGNSQVVNIPGAGGTIGLAQLVTNSRNVNMKIMLSGLIMMGASLSNNSEVTLNDAIPIARLLGEYEVLVVPTSSPYVNLDSFLNDWRDDPGSLSVAGGSAGGTDHMLLGLLAIDQGVDPSSINYLAHSGGGESLAAILGNHVTAGINGYGELRAFIDSGRLRALAISSPERIEGIDIPTFIEQGVDIELANWRSLIASPNEPNENIIKYRELATELNNLEEWGAVLDNNNWTNLFLIGSEFDQFLIDENKRVNEVLSSIGLSSE